uniref:Uncharacterized protein n=1 Tax=Angiostrongylus cantonensis TaxID=6313 RepID=A0A0K0D8C1_ANGCA
MAHQLKDSLYDDSEESFDLEHPLLFKPVRRDSVSNGASPTNGYIPPRLQTVPISSTTVSSFTIPQPQRAELCGPFLPVPVRASDPTNVVAQTENATTDALSMGTSWETSMLANGNITLAIFT